MTDKVIRDGYTYGLRSQCLPFREVLAQSIANQAPTAMPTVGLSLVYGSAGNGSWLAYLLATIGLVFVSLNINQFARRSASPGSFYSYIAKSLGLMAGVICGWSIVLAYLGGAMSVTAAFANYAQVFLGMAGYNISPIFLFAICTGIAWYFAYTDIKLSAALMLLIESVSIGIILTLGIIVWLHKGFAIDPAQLALKGVAPNSIALGLVFSILSFGGFESATALGDEAKNPLKNIPNAVILSTIIGGFFYIFMAYVEVIGFNGSSISLEKNNAPLSFLAEEVGLGFLGLIINVGAMVSFFACALASINASARIFFTMARHQVFHPSLGKAHHSNQTPHVAITMTTLFAFFVPTSISMFGVSTLDIVLYLGNISAYGFLMAYILVSIAAPVYLYKIGQLRHDAILMAVLAVFFMAIPVVGSTGIPGSSVFLVPEHPFNVFPFLFLMYLIVGIAWFLMLRLHSPEVIKHMDSAIETIHTQRMLEKSIEE